MADSSVFRTMVASSTSSPIELSDPELECKCTFERLLDLLVDGTFDLYISIAEFKSLIKLCQKYDFTLALGRISLQTRCTLAEDPVLNLEAFAVGILLDDRELCKTALTASGGRYGKLKDDEKLPFGNYLPDGRFEDPASLSLDDFQCFDHKILWAWGRAYRVAFGPYDYVEEDVKEGLEDLAEEFSRLMKLEGEHVHCQSHSKRHWQSVSSTDRIVGAPKTLS